MGRKNKSKLYKFADAVVTVTVIIVLITAIIAGVIFVAKLVRGNNASQNKKTTEATDITPVSDENNNEITSEVKTETDENTEEEPKENNEDSVDLSENDTEEQSEKIKTDNKPTKPVAVSYEGDLTSAPIFIDGGQTVKMTVDSDNTFAVYFYALIPFSGMEIKCAAGSDVKLSLYAYDTDYSTSVANEPIFSMKYSDTESDSWLASFFGSVDAGEYLAVISSDKSAELFISDEQSALTNGHAVVFINGELDLYNVPYLKVIFDGQTANGEYFN